MGAATRAAAARLSSQGRMMPGDGAAAVRPLAAAAMRAAELVGAAELAAPGAAGNEGEAEAAAGGEAALVRAAVQELLLPADPLGERRPGSLVAQTRWRGAGRLVGSSLHLLAEHNHARRSDGSDTTVAEVEAVSISEAGSSQQGAASHDGEDGALRAASGRGDNAVSEGVRAVGMRRKPTAQRFEVAEQNASPPTRRLSAAASVKNVCGGGGGGARRGSSRCLMPTSGGPAAAFMPAAAAAAAAATPTRASCLSSRCAARS